MRLGAEPKKVAILAGLVALAGYFVYSNFAGGTGPPTAPPSPAPQALVPRIQPVPEMGRPVPRPERPVASSEARSRIQEYRPSLKPRKEGERPDLSAIDPTLRLDLLTKLQDARIEGADRSLFEFSAAPLPKKPEAKIIPVTPAGGAAAAADAKPPEPVKPPPPPIPLRFYGYTTQARQGAKRAFFLDGDDILVASEGDVVKKRYRVVRIGVNSVLVEDLEFKHQQSLPLVAEAG